MLIDSSYTSTVPVDIEQKITEYFSRLPKNIVANMKHCKIEYDNDMILLM